MTIKKKSKKTMSHAEFNRLPKRKKAVLVAKDVIAQIALERFQIRSNTYFDRIHISGLEPSEAPATPAVVDQLAKSCTVCAKGAAFLSCVRLGNKLSVSDLLSAASGFGSNERERMTKIFDSVDYDLIEAAFEGNSDCPDQCELNDYDGKTDKLVRAARDNYFYAFERDYTVDGDGTDHHRLVAIMLNVIENKGRFIPTKKITFKKVLDAIAAARPVVKKAK
jgi:hypothetical protein